MKILAITDSFPPHHSGGYELRCRDVLIGLMNRGHEVQIITTRCPTKTCGLHKDDQDISRVLVRRSETHTIYTRIVRDIVEMRFINRVVDEFKPDIAYLSHLGDLLNPIFFYFSDRNIPIVFDDGGLGIIHVNRIFHRGIYFHKIERDPIIKKWIKDFVGTIIHVISGNLIPKSLKWPTEIRVFFNSRHSKELALDKGVPVENASVIFSGIDTSVFHFKSETIIHNPLRILLPGRIESQKGTKDAVSLLSILKGLHVPVCLTIVGNEDSQSYFEEIVQKLRLLNLEDKAKILPMVNHEKLAELYRDSDICFFPSYHETGFSRVPLEAMACGCLVISYGNEASNEIIKNGETGYITLPGDIHAVAALITNLISDPIKYQQIVKNAVEKVNREFNMEAYLDRVEDYITSSEWHSVLNNQ